MDSEKVLRKKEKNVEPIDWHSRTVLKEESSTWLYEGRAGDEGEGKKRKKMGEVKSDRGRNRSNSSTLYGDRGAKDHAGILPWPGPGRW